MASWRCVLTEKHRGCWAQPGASPGRSCSPQCTWPSASEGTGTAEREACVSSQPPTPGWTCPFLPQSVPATGSLNPFNSNSSSVRNPKTENQRFMTSWLRKRPWGSPDANANLYPIYRAPDHPEFKPLLVYFRGKDLTAFWGSHWVYNSAKD